MKERKQKLQSQADLGSQAYSPSQFLVCSMGRSRYKELSRVSGAWGKLRECSYPVFGWMSRALSCTDKGPQHRRPLKLHERKNTPHIHPSTTENFPQCPLGPQAQWEAL